MDDVKDLVAILKFLKPEEPGSFLLHLLHHICEKFPAEMFADGVTLNRPGHDDPRAVSLQGFLLLEEAESSFGTSIQNIEKIQYEVTLDEPHLSALSSRMKRQENPVASISIREVRLGGGLQSAQAFSILLQADLVNVGWLEVSEAIGEEGWRILAKAIRPGMLGSIHVTRDGVAQGGRDDIKHLFDAGCWFQIFKTLEDLQEDNWQQASLFFKDNEWTWFERVMDMSQQEFGEEIERRRRNGGL